MTGPRHHVPQVQPEPAGFPGAVIRLLWAGCALLAFIVAFTPVTYDTLHVEDTVFIAQIADYVRAGEVPGRDFDHLYGGAHEQVIAWAYALFGQSIKALDLALVLHFLIALAGLLWLARERLDAATTASVAAILAVTLFARQPFEEHVLVQQLTAAHSFAYNRVGTALTILATVALLIPAKRPAAQLSGAALAGLFLTLAVLTKATFLPVVIALALGFILLKRYRECAVFCMSAALCALVFDPSGGRILGTLRYSVDAAGGGGDMFTLLRKALNLVWAQQVYVLIMAGILLLSWRTADPRTRLAAGAAILVLAGFWATTVTMGPAGLSGHPAVPVLCAVAVLMASLTHRGGAKEAGARIGILAAVLMAAFVLPHGLNIVGTAAKAAWNAEHVAFGEGRLKGYLAQGRPYHDSETGRELIYPEDRAAVLAEVARRLRSGEADAGTSYLRLAEAVRLLQEVPGIAGMRVVDDSQLGVSFALGLPRVEGFPTWMRPNSPEFSGDFLRNADLVLLDATGQSRYGDVLRARMQDFLPCRQTALWELHLRADRDGAAAEACSTEGRQGG